MGKERMGCRGRGDIAHDQYAVSLQQVSGTLLPEGLETVLPPHAYGVYSPCCVLPSNGSALAGRAASYGR